MTGSVRAGLALAATVCLTHTAFALSPPSPPPVPITATTPDSTDTVPLPSPPPPDAVVLLHGLGRGSASMRPLARSLEREGYHVVNVRYPSQCADIATLAEGALGRLFGAVHEPTSGRFHIVTHSLGGMLVRRYLNDHGVPAKLGRVDMLAPPNAGSEIVDTLAGCALYARLNGPAGLDLGDRSRACARRHPPHVARHPQRPVGPHLV